MSKIDWTKPIELVNGTPSSVIRTLVHGTRVVEFANGTRRDFSEDGYLVADPLLGPLIRNVAAPAEPVKLSDGSVIRGEWWIRKKAGTAIIYRLANIASFYIDCDDATIYFTDSDSERVKFADARVIAAAIKLDLDAMIGGKDV